MFKEGTGVPAHAVAVQLGAGLSSGESGALESKTEAHRRKAPRPKPRCTEPHANEPSGDQRILDLI